VPIVDLTVPSYVIGAIVGYYVLLLALSRPRPAPPSAGQGPCIVVLVPARNEQDVLGETLANLCDLEYAAGQVRVLVIDDGSTDDTGQIAARRAAADPRVRVLTRRAPDAGIGKSEALNHAFRAVRDLARAGDPWLAGAAPADIVLGIVDADGRLECTGGLDRVAPYFADEAVASVQIGVRIGNAGRSGLARMQDMEFVGFSYLVQIARDRLGSSGLGGNGQFTRLSALSDLGTDPWSPGALTEDLDLGLKLIRRGWRTRYCSTTFVVQQGLEQWSPLLRQRTRWIQGHYQCWRHLVPLLRSRQAALACRLDLAIYLVLVVTVILVSVTMALGVLGACGIIQLRNDFLGFLGDGFARRLMLTLFSILPAVMFMRTYQRHSGQPFRWWETPGYGLIFTLYTYVWLVTTVRALTRLALGRNGWVKTPRLHLDAEPA